MNKIQFKTGNLEQKTKHTGENSCGRLPWKGVKKEEGRKGERGRERNVTNFKEMI